MKCIARLAPLLLASSCAAEVPLSDVEAKTSVGVPLSEEALRRLFLNGLNTYITPPNTGVVESNSPFELFKPNGSYLRGKGFVTNEGTYVVEGDQVCVQGKRIPKQCRKIISKGGALYLLIDVASGSQTIIEMKQAN